MKQVSIIAALGLFTGALSHAVPAFAPLKKGYGSTADRATYYKQTVFSKKTTKELAAMKPAYYVVMTSTPIAPLVGFLGTDANVKYWQADTVNNPNGQACAYNNAMGYYDNNGQLMYLIKGPFNNENAKLSEFSITAGAHAPKGAKAQIAPSPKNKNLVGFTRRPFNKNLVNPDDIAWDKAARKCLYPSIYLPVKQHDFNVGTPAPINVTGKTMNPTIESQFTDMVMFGYNQMVIGASGSAPKTAPTAKELQKVPGIGGILYYDAAGNFVCAFYTNGWANRKEGWTTVAPQGFETLAAQGAN